MRVLELKEVLFLHENFLISRCSSHLIMAVVWLVMIEPELIFLEVPFVEAPLNKSK